eukprot:8962363-Lingulodinium_polyedra.AAC.1
MPAASARVRPVAIRQPRQLSSLCVATPLSILAQRRRPVLRAGAAFSRRQAGRWQYQRRAA